MVLLSSPRQRMHVWRCPWTVLAFVGILVSYSGECESFQVFSVPHRSGLTRGQGFHATTIHHCVRTVFPSSRPLRHLDPARTSQDVKLQMNSGQDDPTRPVLVVGEDRGIRQQIVKTLLDRGAVVRAMVMDPRSSDIEELKQLPSAAGKFTVVQGDICKLEELVHGMNDCRACISFDTSRRSTQPKDLLFKIWDPSNEFLGAWGPSKPDVIPEEWEVGDNEWLDPGADWEHPWNTKFLAQCNLVDAAERTGCGHIVRISDVRVGSGPFSPSNIRDNLMQSMEVKWAHEGELVLHDVADELGLAFTLIRAPEISSKPRPAQSHLQLSTAADSDAGLRIGEADLAALGVECVLEGACQNATVACGWGEGKEGAQVWTELVKGVEAGDGVIYGRELHSTAAFTSLFVPFALVLGYGIMIGQIAVETRFRHVLEAMPFLGLAVTFTNSFRAQQLRSDSSNE